MVQERVCLLQQQLPAYLCGQLDLQQAVSSSSKVELLRTIQEFVRHTQQVG